MRLLKIAGLIILLAVTGPAASGQEQDARWWTSLSVRYDVNKKWRITLEEEARIFENISRLDKLNSELTVDYKINKILECGILYRLINSPDRIGNLDFNHRFSLFLGVEKKWAGFTWSGKAAFQKTYPRMHRTEDWSLSKDYIRVKAEVSRELKKGKTEPYTNLEFWYRTTAGGQSFTDQYRFTLGIKQKLNKSHRLDFFYKIQQDLQVKNPLTAHIFGIGYRYIIN